MASSAHFLYTPLPFPHSIFFSTPVYAVSHYPPHQHDLASIHSQHPPPSFITALQHWHFQLPHHAPFSPHISVTVLFFPACSKQPSATNCLLSQSDFSSSCSIHHLLSNLSPSTSYLPIKSSVSHHFMLITVLRTASSYSSSASACLQLFANLTCLRPYHSIALSFSSHSQAPFPSHQPVRPSAPLHSPSLRPVLFFPLTITMFDSHFPLPLSITQNN